MPSQNPQIKLKNKSSMSIEISTMASYLPVWKSNITFWISRFTNQDISIAIFYSIAPRFFHEYISIFFFLIGPFFDVLYTFTVSRKGIEK